MGQRYGKIVVNVNDDEKDTIEEAANEEGFRGVSTWVRHAALEKAQRLKDEKRERAKRKR